MRYALFSRIAVRGRNYTQARSCFSIRGHQSTPGHTSGVQASLISKTGKDAVADRVGGGFDSVRLLSNLVQQNSQIIDLFQQLLGVCLCAAVIGSKVQKTPL